MKKAWICVLLTAVLLLVGQPQVRESIGGAIRSVLPANETAEEPSREPLFEAAEPAPTDTRNVTLYYRFAQTDVLGMERVELETGREESDARLIVEQLVEGPDAAHGRLSGVFPQGTKVLSVTEDEMTVFVTLSEEFLGRPNGAPADWEDLALWQEEATLRRWLAAQSIVCSLTESGRCQRVQLYTASAEDGAPHRIPLVYFDLDVTDPAVVLAASSRDESAILTPQRAMQMILDAWRRRDWERLHVLLCAADGENLPTLSAFEAQMRSADVTLLTAEPSAGSVDVSGQNATIMLDGAVRSKAGGDRRIIRQSVPLVRYADNWAMRMDTLLTLMGVE